MAEAEPLLTATATGGSPPPLYRAAWGGDWNRARSLLTAPSTGRSHLSSSEGEKAGGEERVQPPSPSPPPSYEGTAATRTNASASASSSASVSVSAQAAYVDPYGYTPLHFAAWNPSGAPADVLWSLLSAYPPAASLPNGKGRTPLHLACWSGTESAIMSVLRFDPASASVVDNNGKSALGDACARGRSADILRALAEADPSRVRREDRWGRTPESIFFRGSHGRLLAAGGGMAGARDVKEVLDDILEKATVILWAGTVGSGWSERLVAEGTGQRSSSVCPSLSFTPAEAAEASVQSPMCPLEVSCLLLERRRDALARPANTEEEKERMRIVHLAASGPTHRFEDFYRCDGCKRTLLRPFGKGPLSSSLLPSNADDNSSGHNCSPAKGNFMFFHRDPARSNRSVRCTTCLASDHAEGEYERTEPAVKSAALLEYLMSLDPNLARLPDPAGSTTVPLHRALRSGRQWHEGVRVLFEAAPDFLRSRDAETGLLPFMTAAVAVEQEEEENVDRGICQRPDSAQQQLLARRDSVGRKSVHRSDECTQLTTIYLILREDPTVIIL